jgi:hypothetical protein
LLQGLGLPAAQLLRRQPGGTLLPRKAGLPVEALQLDSAGHQTGQHAAWAGI